MSASFISLERQTILAPLGVRFQDTVTGAAVDEGLVVTVYPDSNPARRSRAFVNRSGTYVLHRAEGLHDATRGAGDDAFWETLPPGRSFTVEVSDERRRYAPFAFKAQLPARGLFEWVWPLGESSATPHPELASSLSDDFDDNARDAAKWRLGTLNRPPSVQDLLVTVLEQNQRLEVRPRSGQGGRRYNGYLSTATWNATNARASVEVAQATQGNAETLFTIAADSNNMFRFVAQAGRLFFQSRAGVDDTSTDIPYDSTAHRWWSFRHERAPDLLVFETSPDGAAWTRRREVARRSPITAVNVELGAGTSSSVASPGRAFFDNFLLESNPSPAIPLFSAPTRASTPASAIIRAELWNPLTNAPAAYAVLEARAPSQDTTRAISDAEGRVALVFPYPEPFASTDEQGRTLPMPPYTKQEWSVQLRARYAAPAAGQSAPAVPDLRATLAQPRATLWSDAARTLPLTNATLSFGQELIVRTRTTQTGAPLDPVLLPVLHITPAA